MSAVTSAISSIGDAVGDVVSSVGDALEDVGDFVVDDIVKPVANAVEKTVEAAMDDPVNTAIRVAAFAVGGPAGLAIANGTIALAQGASFQDAALTAGKTYAIGQAGAAAGQAAGAAATEAGYGAYAANTAQGATAGLTRAGLSGGDLEQGAIMGGLGGVNASLAKSASDQQFEDWSREQAALAYDNAYSPTEQDVLASDPSIKMDFPLSTPTDATGPGYYDEITGEFIPDENGGLQAPLTDASGTNTMPDDSSPLSTASSGKDVSGSDILDPATDPSSAKYDPLLSKSDIEKGLNFATKAILSPSSGLGSTGTQQATAADYSGLSPLALSGLGSTGPQFLDTSAQYLGPKTSTTTADQSNPARLQELKQLYAGLTPELASALADRGIEAPQSAATQDPSMTTTRFMADGGLADSLNPTEKSLGFVKPYAANMLPAAPMMSNPMKLNPLRHLQESLINRQRTAGGLAHGGLPEKYAEALPKGHKPEFITGLTGYYASGKGTGQSDDIDAMLHDGDYVADADLVAALGDGSSKAGAEALEKFRRQIPHQEHAVGGAAVAAKIADGEYVFPASFVTAIGQGDNKAGAKILDKMREAIRAHKRSAPTTKIPPKAKSPLDYLKMVKG